MSRDTDYWFGNGSEVEQRVLDALGPGIEVERRPDGVYHVHLGGRGYIAFGEHGGWWNATEYPPTGGAGYSLYSGGDLGELGGIITAGVTAWAGSARRSAV